MCFELHISSSSIWPEIIQTKNVALNQIELEFDEQINSGSSGLLLNLLFLPVLEDLPVFLLANSFLGLSFWLELNACTMMRFHSILQLNSLKLFIQFW